MFAIRDDRYVGTRGKLIHALTRSLCREYVQQEDLTKAARKVGEAKKHESKHRHILTCLPNLTLPSHHSQT